MAEAKDKQQTAPAAPTSLKGTIPRHPTNFHHVFLIDIQDNGILREVAIVKEGDNGSLYYLDIALMDNTDKARLLKLVMSPHADKYALWDLMSLERLPNGLNALDYFHQMVRQKVAPGHTNTAMGGGLLGVRPEGGTIGAGFTIPDSASFG